MKIEESRVYLGNCLDLMDEMKPESVDAVITDPPYGVSFQSNMPVEGFGKDLIRNDDFKGWEKMLPKMFAHFVEVLRPHGMLAMFCAGGGGTPSLPIAWLKCADFFEVENVLIWDRLDIGLGWRYRPQWEAIILAFKGGRDDKAWYGPQNRANILRQPRIIPQAGEHPTPKPIPLIGPLIEDNTKEGELILDPFCGGGNILEACHILKRRWVGMELEPKYHKMSEEKMNAMLAQGSLF